MSAAFLGEAKNRLLPASVPFRYFISATVFHVFAWIILFLGANSLPGFTGGPGLILASLHLLTLGVFVMTAMGASFQLLPVATRQALRYQWLTKLSFWLFMPGTLMLTWSMYNLSSTTLYLSFFAMGSGLLFFTLLTANNLYRAHSAMPVVTAHGWGAITALIILSILGISLLLNFTTGFIEDRQSIAAVHFIFATFGFMGLLVFGFSHVLIPMFVLSRSLPSQFGWYELTLSTMAIVVAITGILMQNNNLIIFATLLGIASSATYLWLMRIALRTSIRKRLGLSFVIIKASWSLLVISLLLALALMMDLPVPNGMTLFGFLLIVGWLLTFLTGILQRIMPFLASMHVCSKDGKPPLLSELTAERPLVVHAVCHFAALGFCSTGIVLNAPVLVKTGAVFGFVGAIAFAGFAGYIIRKMQP